MDQLSRREFVAAAVGATGAAAACTARGAGAPAPAPQTTLFRAPPLERVRMAFVGVGGMGTVHLQNFLTIEGVEVRAICDIVTDKVARAQQLVVDAGQPRPRGYDRGPRDFERMCEEEELNLVLTATTWEWHVPVCLAAMASGKHAATEVPAAVTIDECWQLVEAAERHRRHCVMLENCCYDRREMLMLNLVRQGVFGELLHAECGYNHDLREVKFSTEGEGLWRRAHSMRRNGNLYPTHGLGPIAQCMDINRGNQFDYLVSMSSPSRGLQLWQDERLGASDPRRSERYVLGDVNLTLMRTVRGQTIYLVHDTNLPRPYTRINMLQGTRGLMQGWPERIYVEGRSARAHQWEGLERWYAEHEHPLWRWERARLASRGHGGMDFLEDWRLIVCLRNGLPTDMNVYDAASWSAVSECTERSVAQRSRPVPVPDFTRGRWREAPPLDIVGPEA
ncbi:MAG TPA: Gfo/Idh/MocA family oxidoreductase [Gemmatimonadales bacterium]|nr:Gfo/Idh/MocA family oxidoreductase [Gemmatimonadales bacterium]